MVTVRDDGFSQTDIQARVGDHLIFQLDSVATRPHTLAWETGQLQYHFDRARGNNTAQYGPLRAGRLRFFDSDTVAGPDAGPPFAGTLVVSDAPPQYGTCTPPAGTSNPAYTNVVMQEAFGMPGPNVGSLRLRSA